MKTTKTGERVQSNLSPNPDEHEPSCLAANCAARAGYWEC